MENFLLIALHEWIKESKEIASIQLVEDWVRDGGKIRLLWVKAVRMFSFLFIFGNFLKSIFFLGISLFRISFTYDIVILI